MRGWEVALVIAVVVVFAAVFIGARLRMRDPRQEGVAPGEGNDPTTGVRDPNA